MRRSAALFVALAACTSTASPERPATEASPSPRPPIRVPVIATLSGPDGDADETYLNGMTLAREEINAAGGIGGRPLELPLHVDDDGDLEATVRYLHEVLAARPPALLLVGAAEAVRRLRPEIEAAGVPVILFRGDLYSARSLFRLVFQTATPWRWQARVAAHYLVVDRGHQRVALLTQPGPDEESIRQTFAEAMAEEGVSVADTVSVMAPSFTPDLVAGFDAAVVAADSNVAPDILEAVATLEEPPQVILSSEAVVPQPSFVSVPAGTVTTQPYTWSVWAEPIPRVRSFRARFNRRWTWLPEANEQEGYDAVMAVADAMERTEGRGGEPLVKALESFRDQTYSSIPIRLGPDDHVLAEQSQLGLFAVEAPGAPAPGEALGAVPWRPIMRTFTTDGEKVNILDRDKRVFFPFWHPKRPSPKYWRSRYGIVTRLSDPLH